ncbi:hypothetical protein HIM_01325 [Hirsutella minnesotensis 3608]|nr:hypothetical protein HIM_01325 [Hirsutella minnesotensis 3608]
MAAYDTPESADEYGRRSGCFIDHRRHRFRYRNHVPDIRATASRTTLDESTDQSNLNVCSIPWPDIPLDSPVGSARLDLDPRDARSWSPNRQLQDLQALLLPRDDLDLGSVPDLDVQDLSRQISTHQCNVSLSWLPISPLDDREGGLKFSARSLRLQSLMRRELALERVKSPQKASSYGEELVENNGQSNPHPSAYASSRASNNNFPDAITPPLSPVSDYSSPSVPPDIVTALDVTSEPRSPTPVEKRRPEHFLDSNISRSPSTAKASSPRLDLGMSSKVPKERVLVDIPLVSIDSESSNNIDLSTHVQAEQLDIEHNEQTPVQIALKMLLGSPQLDPATFIEREQLNPVDAIARVPVPVLNFQVPEPAWLSEPCDAREQFSLLQADATASFHLPLHPRDGQLDRSLRWALFPPTCGSLIPTESMDFEAALRGQSTQNHLIETQSQRYLSFSAELSILTQSQDNELPELLSTEASQCSPCRGSAEDLGNEPAAEKEEAIEIFQHRRDWENDRERRHSKARADGPALLPSFMDPNATSTLLSAFMELRAVKRPRLCSVQGPSAESPSEAGPFHVEALSDDRIHAPTCELAEPITPAPTPSFDSEVEKGPFFISLTLQRSVLRILEAAWPRQLIFDRDYDESQSLESTSRTGLGHSLGCEADISISPSTGVVVTTLVKVKQKPLPGSGAQSILRGRVERVSQKYETLIVLVSQCNSLGDIMGTPSSSDMTAYADFVSFAASFDGRVGVYLVPGAETTLAQWILALLARYGAGCAVYTEFLTPTDSDWVLFLRRAGFNVFAAQVLSKTLAEEYGNCGLTQFLALPARVKASKYGALLGSEPLVLNCSKMLDQDWE